MIVGKASQLPRLNECDGRGLGQCIAGCGRRDDLRHEVQHLERARLIDGAEGRFGYVEALAVVRYGNGPAPCPGIPRLTSNSGTVRCRPSGASIKSSGGIAVGGIVLRRDQFPEIRENSLPGSGRERSFIFSSRNCRLKCRHRAAVPPAVEHRYHRAGLRKIGTARGFEFGTVPLEHLAELQCARVLLACASCGDVAADLPVQVGSAP